MRKNFQIEPYRILFPLGWTLGIAGVLLWPLFVYGLYPYPALPHARVMIQGFAACFILGFMGTALPHMLESKPFRVTEVFALAGGLLWVSVLHVAGYSAAADGLFVCVLITFLFFGARRWPARRDMPPPGLVAAMLGILCAILGTIIQALYFPMNLPAVLFPLGKLLLYQGFLLLPVLGIGGFILPVFMGYERKLSTGSVPGFPSRKPSRTWWKQSGVLLAFSLVVIGSFALEAAGQVRGGYFLRAATLVIFFARYIPIHRDQRATGALSWNMRIALFCVVLGYGLAAIWTLRHLALLHVVFMTGFGLLIFAVAARVIVAHGGQRHLFAAHIVSVWVMFGLVVLAMLTRVSADWMPATRFNHYAYAAMAWIPGALVWAWGLFRYLFSRDDEAAMQAHVVSVRSGR